MAAVKDVGSITSTAGAQSTSRCHSASCVNKQVPSYSLRDVKSSDASNLVKEACIKADAHDFISKLPSEVPAQVWSYGVEALGTMITYLNNSMDTWHALLIFDGWHSIATDNAIQLGVGLGLNTRVSGNERRESTCRCGRAVLSPPLRASFSRDKRGLRRQLSCADRCPGGKVT